LKLILCFTGSDAAANKITITSAEGRRTTSYLDDKGRIIKEEVLDLANVYYEYDERGRLISITEGEGEAARTATLTYDPNSGYIAKITDTLDRSETFTRDKVGRILSQKLPDGRQINYRFDANGNVTSITPPSKPVHQFDYTPVDLQQQYTPPTVTGISAPQTHYSYNLDKQLLQIRRPDGQTIDLVYDEVKGRLDRIDLPNEESINYTYFEDTGKLKTVTASDGGTLSHTYDGSLMLSETWKNGSVVGTLTLDYDNHFQVISVGINGNTVNYQYDADNLLIKAGDLNLTRNAQNGLLTATQLSHLTTERTHNIFGEMIEETARYETDTLYHTEYSRDKLGRITQRVETTEGITTTIDYRYDLAGRLVEVKQNGVVTEAYSYDGNGNRLTAQTENSVTNGSYDEQDRLIQYSNNTYNYTTNGELLSKNNNGEITQYRYDLLGNLRSIQLPEGQQIEYLIDARNRRIGKKVNGVLTQGFLYQDSLNPIAELDGNGNVVSRFIYGSKANIPDYMLKNGKTYRILSDHLGSPRLVVDISNGSIAQKMDYDAFGNVIFDSNPGFQPFGFAGGIYDLDTKLTRFGARDYDAQIGRWLAKDEALFNGGMNLYLYVVNDPVNSIDMTGYERIMLFSESDRAGRVAKRVVPDDEPGILHIAAHADSQVIADDRQGKDQRKKLNATELEELIRESSLWKEGMPIKLWACEAGKGENSIAEQLGYSMRKDVPYVQAPNAYAIWVALGDGGFFIGDSLLEFAYLPNPFKKGDWITFYWWQHTIED
jgi:RHS repeat-associated protein